MVLTWLKLAAFWIFMFFTLLFFIPLAPLELFGPKRLKENYVLSMSRFWARFSLALVGARVEVQGLENLPEESNICFVSNHQSYLDIPLVMASLPRIIGFLSKKELKYVPLLNGCMKTIGCFFIDRGNPRQTVEVFEKAAEDIRRGRAKLIFPEGTRSRGAKMGSIRSGALKLAFKSEASVVPLTIDGTYHLFEETGRMVPADVRLTVHPPLSAAGLSRDEQKEFARKVEERISSGLMQ